MDQAGVPTYSGAPAGTAAYETPTQGPRLRHQSVGIRFAATVIDSLVLGLISWILIVLAIGSAFSSVAPIQPATTGDINATVAQINATLTQVSGALSAGIVAAAVITLIVWFLYYTLLEAAMGRRLANGLLRSKLSRKMALRSATATLRLGQFFAS